MKEMRKATWHIIWSWVTAIAAIAFFRWLRYHCAYSSGELSFDDPNLKLHAQVGFGVLLGLAAFGSTQAILGMMRGDRTHKLLGILPLIVFLYFVVRVVWGN